ncbi:MAG TPA: hypothetical protein VG347_19800 [Verrucomicrobiae bacterium]|nr:hypothetical protein [Verrucomicrobiae bacterium]
MRQLFLLAGLALAMGVNGCSTVTSAQHFGDAKLDSYKSAYVVIAPSGNPNIAGYIVTGLAHHNLKVNSGALKDKPAEVGFYVTYQEHWNWDLAVYLDTLDVQFMDNTNNQLIANGSFRNNKFFETQPDPRDKTIEVVDGIFAK